MKKLLWISDFVGSGYAMASNTILNELLKSNKYDIYILPINTMMDKKFLIEKIKSNLQIQEKKILYELTASPDIAKTNNPLSSKYYYENIVGLFNIDRFVEKVRPDIIFSINDNGILSNHINTLNFNYRKWNGKMYGYLAIDCTNFRKDFFKCLNNYDKIIAMTEFGKNELIKSEFKRPLSVLNHPINNNFQVLDKNKCRNELFGNILNNKFVILNTNIACKRKRHDITLKAFAEFCKDKDDVVLIFKCAYKNKNKLDVNSHFDMEKMTNRFVRDKNKVLFLEQHLDLDKLCKLFNCPDVGINTTSGEGWGLTPCEMALCGVPQIIPNNTSYPEIFGKNYDYIKTEEQSHSAGRNNISDDGVLYKNDTINPNSIVSFLVSYPTFVEDNSSHEFVEKLEIQKDCYNILLSEFGSNDLQNLNKSNVSLNDLDIHLNLNNISLVEELYNTQKDLFKNKPIQIIIQLGKDGSFLIKNALGNKRIFESKNRTTYQLDSELLYGTYDQNGIKVHIPTIEDTVRILNKYYYNRDLLKKDGKKCRKEILSKFSPEKICNQLINILEN